MKRFFVSAALMGLISFSSFAFTEKDIISPASGTWCNQQALVLSSSNAVEIYYSLTGSDPFVSGFAYDGPVLIDKKGNVKVRIGVVEADGVKKEYVIDYNVMPAVFSDMDEETAVFAEKNLSKTPLITYYCGTEFYFPSGIRYSFEKTRTPFLRQKLELNSKNHFERYASFFATDGFNNYHSVIRIVPAESATVEKKTGLPFSITEWNCFTFTDKRFIYQIDGEMWNAEYSDRIIDRTVAHTIHWQTVDYAENSIVYEYVLPAIPKVGARNEGNGMVAFVLPEEGNYTFENGEKTIFAEAFYGEDTKETFVPKIYLDGILNGGIKVDCDLDRLAPEEPVITASGDSTFSRNTLALKVGCSENADVYYSVSEPVYHEDGKDLLSDVEITMPADFIRYDGSAIVIKSHKAKSCIYKVFAYAVDAAGNKSKVVEKKYIIDEYNFYVDGSSDSEKADGSFMNPFVSLEQVVAAINSSEGGRRIHLKGDLSVGDGEHVITKDCVVYGNGGKIIFNGSASLAVENASVEIESCTLEKHSESNVLLAKVKGGAIAFKDCEIAGFYKEDGRLFEIKDSNVSFVDCGITLSAARIALCADINGGTFKSSGSRFTSIGQSASALKLVSVDATFEHNLFTLIGGICKGVEVAGGNISFAGDVFNAQSDGKYRNSGAVLRNAGCRVSGLSSTRSSGF